MTDDLTTNAAGGDLGLPGASVVPAAPAFSPAEAESRKSEFMANKEKTTALMNGDAAATAEWRLITQNLWQPAQFTQPRDEVTEHLQESSGYALSPEVLQEFRENRPVTPDEHRMARARFDARKQDAEWIAKLKSRQSRSQKGISTHSINLEPPGSRQPSGRKVKMPKVKTHGWSVAGEKIKEKIKPGMPAEQVAAIEQQANDQGIADVFGADWRQHVDAQGRPQEVGIGSDIWLMNVDDEQAERHWAAVARFVGPAAAAAGRERIKRMKDSKGK
jgi:hypothetical protein